MVDIFNQVYTQLKNAIELYANTDDGKALLGNRIPVIKPSYERNETTFPYITIEEKENRFAGAETDSWETFSRISYEVNYYDNKPNKIAVCRALAYQGNFVLSRRIGVKRGFQDSVPNILDGNIYRLIQRFDGFINNDRGVVYNNQP